jgi:hypothetical protein
VASDEFAVIGSLGDAGRCDDEDENEKTFHAPNSCGAGAAGDVTEARVVLALGACLGSGVDHPRP